MYLQLKFIGNSMESIWNLHGPVHGIHMKSPGECKDLHHSMNWSMDSPYGFHMDSMEFPMNFICKSMYYSIWNPWNSPYGIHGTFHMDQSIWIPWNSPHRTVHMDSIHGILRDLIRIVMNVFKYNLIPLLYIYSKEKKNAEHEN
jgi:hypothetical protein